MDYLCSKPAVGKDLSVVSKVRKGLAVNNIVIPMPTSLSTLSDGFIGRCWMATLPTGSVVTCGEGRSLDE